VFSAISCSLASAALLIAGCSSNPEPACGASCAPAAKWTELALIAGHLGGPGWVDGPASAAHFEGPFNLACDGKNHVYLTDASRIRDYDLSSNTVRTIAGGPTPGSADGAATKATFFQPNGILVAGDVLYVADEENNTVRKLDLVTNQVSTLTGQARVVGYNDGVGTAALFQEAMGVAWDRAAGLLYLTDTDNHTIRTLDLTTGVVATIAGKATVSGTDDGIGGAARFAWPVALALDVPSQTLFISDTGNLSIRKMTLADLRVSTVVAALPGDAAHALVVNGSELLATVASEVVGVSISTGAIRTLAGSATTPGFVDGTGAAARFVAPYGMASDGHGSLFIADPGGNALRKLTLASGVVTTVAGSSSMGAIDGVAETARFSRAQGIVEVSPGLLYVADTQNDAIRSVALASGKVSTVAGALGEAGHVDGKPAVARFDRPSAIALDAGRYLYIAELGNQDLRRIDLSSGVVSTLALKSEPASAAVKLIAPQGLAFDRGHLYVTESARILSVDIATGKISVLAADPGTSSVFAALAGIVADGHGKLLVADVLKNSVLQVAIDTGAVTTFVGPVGLGVDRLYYPRQLALRADGTLFVADAYTVRQVKKDGSELTTVVGVLDGRGVRLGTLPAQLSDATAIALTSKGTLAIVVESSILEVR
jgi:DNA-binding beta-propeller fold protein YncE